MAPNHRNYVDDRYYESRDNYERPTVGPSQPRRRDDQRDTSMDVSELRDYFLPLSFRRIVDRLSILEEENQQLRSRGDPMDVDDRDFDRDVPPGGYYHNDRDAYGPSSRRNVRDSHFRQDQGAYQYQGAPQTPRDDRFCQERDFRHRDYPAPDRDHRFYPRDRRDSRSDYQGSRDRDPSPGQYLARRRSRSPNDVRHGNSRQWGPATPHTRRLDDSLSGFIPHGRDSYTGDEGRGRTSGLPPSTRRLDDSLSGFIPPGRDSYTGDEGRGRTSDPPPNTSRLDDSLTDFIPRGRHNYTGDAGRGRTSDPHRYPSRLDDSLSAFIPRGRGNHTEYEGRGHTSSPFPNTSRLDDSLSEFVPRGRDDRTGPEGQRRSVGLEHSDRLDSSLTDFLPPRAGAYSGNQRRGLPRVPSVSGISVGSSHHASAADTFDGDTPSRSSWPTHLGGKSVMVPDSAASAAESSRTPAHGRKKQADRYQAKRNDDWCIQHSSAHNRPNDDRICTGKVDPVVFAPFAGIYPEPAGGYECPPSQTVSLFTNMSPIDVVCKDYANFVAHRDSMLQAIQSTAAKSLSPRLQAIWTEVMRQMCACTHELMSGVSAALKKSRKVNLGMKALSSCTDEDTAKSLEKGNLDDREAWLMSTAPQLRSREGGRFIDRIIHGIDKYELQMSNISTVIHFQLALEELEQDRSLCSLFLYLSACKIETRIPYKGRGWDKMFVLPDIEKLNQKLTSRNTRLALPKEADVQAKAQSLFLEREE